MREHFVSHYGVRNLRGCHQIHLEQPRLQRPFLFLVAFEHVQQERSGLLQAIVLHEYIRDDIEIKRHALRKTCKARPGMRGLKKWKAWAQQSGNFFHAPR